MTTDPHLAFVGTYTDSEEDGVFGFRVDEGTLDGTSAVSGGPDPTFLAPDPTGDHLYVANRPDADTGQIIAYAIDHETGSLDRLNAAETGGGGTPCHCSVDATGSCVLSAQYGGGTVSVVPIRSDGRVGERTAVVEHEGSGPNADRQSGPHPHSIQPGPDNEYAYAPDLGADQVFIYDLDPDAGTIEPADCGHAAVQPGAGPRHLDFGPDGRVAYLINELDSTVTAFERDSSTGGLTAIATEPTLPDGYEGENKTADIHVHPSGEYLYGSNRGHDSIAIFDLDAEGHPTFVGTESTRGEWPRNFALDPAGDYLFAENADTDDIVTFRIADDGSLSATGAVESVPSPVCLRFVDE